MQNIRRELLLRDEEVDNMIKFLEFMENNGGLVRDLIKQQPL